MNLKIIATHFLSVIIEHNDRKCVKYIHFPLIYDDVLELT